MKGAEVRGARPPDLEHAVAGGHHARPELRQPLREPDGSPPGGLTEEEVVVLVIQRAEALVPRDIETYRDPAPVGRWAEDPDR